MDYDKEEFDFAVIADNIFLKNDTDVNLIFAVTWKDKSSKLIINCRESSKRKIQNQGIAKIKSFTIAEFEALHNELCTIEPKIKPYFPNNFTYKIVEIERLNNSSWNFFSLSPASIVEQEKDLSDETAEAIKHYLNAVTEICGQKLLLNIFFKEDNEKYFEDHNEFIKKESKKKIQQSESECSALLSCHSDFINLKSLIENLYVKEDVALQSFQDALFYDSLMLSLPLTEESEAIKEKLEKILSDLQISEIGPKMLVELKSIAEDFLQQYYKCYKEVLYIKINLSKKQREMYLKYILKMKEDQNKYPVIIFRDCVGQRMSQLAENFHKENEKIGQLYLDLHSTKDLIVMRKIELIRSWTEGQEMVRGNVRHEDVSLIQLKNLDRSNIESLLLDEYYAFISETYKLLLDYNESQRLGLDNKKHIIDDPLDIILPITQRFKTNLLIKAEDKDPFQSIDYSGLIEKESESDFEDALDEDQFGTLKKTENKKINIRNDCENKLKDIANRKAELRNSKARLVVQYEKLNKKVTERSENSYECSNLESLHPIKDKDVKKTMIGSSLSAEQRKQDAKKARERIKKYQEKLKKIPENEAAKSIKPKVIPRSSKSDKDFIHTVSVENTQSNVSKTILPLNVPPPPPPPLKQPPQPPPLKQPPPPPPPIPPTTIVIKATIPTESSNNKNISYIDELNLAFTKRKAARTSGNIDEEVLARKQKNTSQILSSLSSVVDSRRKFFNSEDDNN